MKKNHLTRLILLIAICLTVFVSCEEESQTFDCPEIEANIGDECFVGNGTPGIVSEDCECIIDGPVFDCPEIEANFGDVCLDLEGNEGVISEDCECIVEEPVFDCPEIEANFGDECFEGNGTPGIVSEDCECIVEGPVYDCPEIEANFGDSCVNTNDVEGTISEDCECIVEEPVFDCPEIQANFGDVCLDAGGNEGTISEDCECIVAQTCNYQGVILLESNSNTTILIAESALRTEFFYSSSNGPEVEIYETNNPGNFNFTTTVVALNATGTGILNYNGTTYTVNVTCLKTGNAVGQEMRFNITAPELEAEICVIIDWFQ